MPDMYGLIGNPLGHSFSRQYFKEKFAREGIPGDYGLFELKGLGELPKLLETHKELSGLNVTIPYKKEIIPYLDSLEDAAADIEAVNVLDIRRDRAGRVTSLRGYNTDWIGFHRSLAPLLEPEIRRALVLGNGGAAKAVVYALKKTGIVPTIVSRSGAEGTLRYEELDKERMSENLLIVNTTPLGMYPNVDSAPDIPYGDLSARHICYDLVYNPALTKFMELSRVAGARVKNGLEMLHIQAEEAWSIWNAH